MMPRRVLARPGGGLFYIDWWQRTLGGIGGMCIAPDTGRLGYMMWNGNFYTSDDWGVNWTQRGTHPHPYSTAPAIADIPIPSYGATQNILMSPLYRGTAYSEDGGDTWTSIDLATGTSGLYDATWDPYDNRFLISGANRLRTIRPSGWTLELNSTTSLPIRTKAVTVDGLWGGGSAYAYKIAPGATSAVTASANLTNGVGSIIRVGDRLLIAPATGASASTYLTLQSLDGANFSAGTANPSYYMAPAAVGFRQVTEYSDCPVFIANGGYAQNAPPRVFTFDGAESVFVEIGESPFLPAEHRWLTNMMDRVVLTDLGTKMAVGRVRRA